MQCVTGVSKSVIVLAAALACVTAGTDTASGSVVAYWPFDGHLNDATGNGNNGTAHGGVSFGAGMSGQALYLDGTGYVDLEEVTNLDGFSTFKVEFWAMPATDLNINTARQDFIYKGPPAQNGVSYLVTHGDADGVLSGHGHSQSNWFNGISINHVVDFPANEWFHVAMVYDGISSLQLFLNGVRVGTEVGTGMSGPLFDNADPLTVGRRPDSLFFFHGAIDELRIQDVPEPAALSLLALGGMALLKRKAR